MTTHKLDSIKKHIKFRHSKIYSKLLHKSDIKIPDVKSNNLSLNTGFFTILFTLIWNGIIIYYLHNLEDSSCKCIRDWRHDFMKTVAFINIILSIIPLLTINIKFNKYLLMGLGISIIILNSIYIYAFYTYIGILNSTNCECAIVNEPNLNYLLNYRRGTIVIFYVLGILTILTGINISFSINIHNKKFKYDL
jgi:hypothetical protein